MNNFNSTFFLRFYDNIVNQKYGTFSGLALPTENSEIKVLYLNRKLEYLQELIEERHKYLEDLWNENDQKEKLKQELTYWKEKARKYEKILWSAFVGEKNYDMLSLFEHLNKKIDERRSQLINWEDMIDNYKNYKMTYTLGGLMNLDHKTRLIMELQQEKLFLEILTFLKRYRKISEMKKTEKGEALKIWKQYEENVREENNCLMTQAIAISEERFTFPKIYISQENSKNEFTRVALTSIKKSFEYMQELCRTCKNEDDLLRFVNTKLAATKNSVLCLQVKYNQARNMAYELPKHEWNIKIMGLERMKKFLQNYLKVNNQTDFIRKIEKNKHQIEKLEAQYKKLDRENVIDEPVTNDNNYHLYFDKEKDEFTRISNVKNPLNISKIIQKTKDVTEEIIKTKSILEQIEEEIEKQVHKTYRERKLFQQKHQEIMQLKLKLIDLIVSESSYQMTLNMLKKLDKSKDMNDIENITSKVNKFADKLEFDAMLCWEQFQQRKKDIVETVKSTAIPARHKINNGSLKLLQYIVTVAEEENTNNILGSKCIVCKQIRLLIKNDLQAGTLKDKTHYFKDIVVFTLPDLEEIDINVCMFEIIKKEFSLDAIFKANLEEIKKTEGIDQETHPEKLDQEETNFPKELVKKVEINSDLKCLPHIHLLWPKTELVEEIKEEKGTNQEATYPEKLYEHSPEGIMQVGEAKKTNSDLIEISHIYLIKETGSVVEEGEKAEGTDQEATHAEKADQGEADQKKKIVTHVKKQKKQIKKQHKHKRKHK